MLLLGNTSWLVTGHSRAKVFMETDFTLIIVVVASDTKTFTVQMDFILRVSVNTLEICIQKFENVRSARLSV